jgi:hypothetical protein
MLIGIGQCLRQCVSMFTPMFVIVFWYWLMFLGEVLSLHFWRTFDMDDLLVDRHWSMFAPMFMPMFTPMFVSVNINVCKCLSMFFGIG